LGHQHFENKQWPCARGLLSYLSYKRKGVDTLARAMGAQTPGFVFDAGSGKGAYAHWFLGKKTPQSSPLIGRSTRLRDCALPSKAA